VTHFDFVCFLNRKGYKHGKGKLKAANGEVYEGDFQNNDIHGKGIYTWPDGRIYDGDVSHDVHHFCNLLLMDVVDVEW